MLSIQKGNGAFRLRDIVPIPILAMMALLIASLACNLPIKASVLSELAAQTTAAVSEPAGVRTDQFEVTQSPATVRLHTSEATQVTFGLRAIEKIVAPTLGGKQLAGELPTGSTLVFRPDGTAFFNYSDLFERNFRGRKQIIAPGEEFENILQLPTDYLKPKVLLDVHNLEGAELVFSTTEDALFFVGDLVYKFDFGMPITAFRLSSPDKSSKTVVGGNLEILASNDGANWTDIYRAPGDQDDLTIDPEIPDVLLGQGTLYLMFRSREASLFDLHVSAKLDSSELTSLLQLEAGTTQLEFTYSGGSSQRAILFWQGAGVQPNPANVTQRDYPAAAPEVVESADAITILFPQQVGIVLGRSQGGGLTGIQNLFVDQRDLLSAQPGAAIAAPSLEILGPGEVGGVTDWSEYLIERMANDFQWPQRGERETHTLSLESAEYLGHTVEGDSVSVLTRVTDGGESAEMTWVFTPVETMLGGRDYRGLGWQVRLDGLEQATWLHIVEPAAMRFGDWALQQTWGRFIESQLGFSAPLTIPASWYFAEVQPFYFAAGPYGSVVSFFDAPVAAQVAVDEDAGRHFLNVAIPLGAGSVRETPVKFWLWSDDPFPTKWAALDEWTAVYAALATDYRAGLGLGVTTPKPTFWWQRPTEQELWEAIESGPPELEQSWLYNFAHTQLNRMAELGFRVIYLESQWDSDGQHPFEEYLAGSDSFGSIDAPWRLEIGAIVGGELALQELVARAHELDLKIVLWATPGHFSNSSPLLQEHPDWIAWRSDGTPDHQGYSDIVGMNLHSGYYDYAVSQYQSLYDLAPFDGVWQDSFLTFGVSSDSRETQPAPQFERTLALQRELREMGATEIHIEGVGPFGLSTAGYGYESFRYGPPEEAAKLVEIFERLRGHEYGLYRYVADTFVEPESYYRTLASGGAVGVYDLQVLEELSEDALARVVQANEDYMSVIDKLGRRHLVAQGDTWQGVSWTKEGSSDEVLFAFEPINYPVSGSVIVEDVTSGEEFEAEDSFTTEAYHTYVIRQPG